MSNYLITLTPTGRFFFGGDMTFMVNGKETEYTSYIIESNKFPQQTSLFGMLRFLILRNSGESIFKDGKIIDKNKEAAIGLIGSHSFSENTGHAANLTYEINAGFKCSSHSFSENTGHAANNFGKIKSLSPCYLQKECDGHWFDLYTAPADYGMNVNFENVTSATLNETVVQIPQMDYCAKEYREQVYICAGCSEIKESEIFQKDVRNGINRDVETGLVEDSALFKQVFYRLKKGYRFAFEADVEDLSESAENCKRITKYNGQLVQIGADSSMFVIGIEEKTDEKKVESTNGTRLVLSSPAFIEAKDMKLARFAITRTIPFKCIQTNVDTESYNRISRKESENEQYSNKYNLYDTGSVFYFKNDEDCRNFAEVLEQKKEFRQIGYNHYRIINN